MKKTPGPARGRSALAASTAGLAGVFSLLVLGASDVRSGDRLSFALTGARVVAAPGRTFDPGVVIVRGGVVESVGDAGKVSIPADARVYDLKGKVVHAAFVDPYVSAERLAGRKPRGPSDEEEPVGGPDPGGAPTSPRSGGPSPRLGPRQRKRPRLPGGRRPRGGVLSPARIRRRRRRAHGRHAPGPRRDRVPRRRTALRPGSPGGQRPGHLARAREDRLRELRAGDLSGLRDGRRRARPPELARRARGGATPRPPTDVARSGRRGPGS